MIEFISEEVRLQYHMLPIDKQADVEHAARTLLPQGKIVTVTFADAETSEVVIRVDEKFDPLSPVA